MKNPLSRRAFLETSLFAGASTLMASRLAFASAPTDARFVFVLLRGALDGLNRAGDFRRGRNLLDCDGHRFNRDGWQRGGGRTCVLGRFRSTTCQKSSQRADNNRSDIHDVVWFEPRGEDSVN